MQRDSRTRILEIVPAGERNTKGTVKWLNADKCFGFIAPGDGIVHRSDQPWALATSGLLPSQYRRLTSSADSAGADRSTDVIAVAA